MAQLHRLDPALLVVAAFSRHGAALDWARKKLETLYGPVPLVSPAFAFNQTAYYEAAMGPGLRKQFLAFERLVNPASLPAIKRQTIQLEGELVQSGSYPEPRPLNVDPGHLSLGKFCLATTKDQQHRIYLRDGIYAEVTLRFKDGVFEPWDWTYADYREPAVRQFLKEARDFYKERLRSSPGDTGAGTVER